MEFTPFPRKEVPTKHILLEPRGWGMVKAVDQGAVTCSTTFGLYIKTMSGVTPTRRNWAQNNKTLKLHAISFWEYAYCLWLILILKKARLNLWKCHKHKRDGGSSYCIGFRFCEWRVIKLMETLKLESCFCDSIFSIKVITSHNYAIVGASVMVRAIHIPLNNRNYWIWFGRYGLKKSKPM